MFMLLTFIIKKEDKFWTAKCNEEDIFTQATSLDTLMANIKEAVELHFEDEIKEKKEKIQIVSLSQVEVGAVA